MSFDENSVKKFILQLRREIVAGESKLTRESIDGRRLYKYRISPDKLDSLEEELSKPRCSDAARVWILAPLAAGRFSANYEGGPPRWNDCGKEVLKLYRPGDDRFKRLMADSLRHYKIDVICRDNNVLLLETIIRESGLPSPMLADGKPLRELLDALMDRAARGDDVFDAATRLVEDENRLPKRYKDAGLPQLCAELVIAVDRLKQDSGWNGGPLDRIWEGVDWDQKLPFRVSVDKAKEIVGCLLQVAESAEESTPLSIDRILCEVGANWKLRARIAFPVSGHAIDVPNLPNVPILSYTVDGEITDEACRIRKHGDDSLYRVARSPTDLSELFASPSRTLSLSVGASDGTQQIIDCQGGERLDPVLPWIFITCGDKKHIYIDSGDRRSRAPELLVATLPGTKVTGSASKLLGSLDVASQDGEPLIQRSIWRVQGIAEFQYSDLEQARIEAGYTGPDVHLNFSGRAANIEVRGCSGTYIGDPKPRRVGGLSGKIQWRLIGDNQWSMGTVRTTGKITCRLVDDAEVELAKRNVYIFPEGFDCKVLRNHVELTLGEGFSVAGCANQFKNTWRIEFGNQQQIVAFINAPGGAIELRFKRPQPTAFHNVATGEQFVGQNHVVSSQIMGGLVAKSYQHNQVLVKRRYGGLNASHSFSLVDNKLRLSEIKAFLNALAFSYRGKTHPLRVEFPNQAGLNIETYRIFRNESLIRISGASDEMKIELHELVPEKGRAPINITLGEKHDHESWLIPDLREGSLYLAIDSSHQAAPCLIKGNSSSENMDSRTFRGCITIDDESERLNSLHDLYQQITAQPNDGYNLGQIDDCLEWIGRFQFELKWVDPFLALALNPALALKMLVLASIRKNIPAQRGLYWALEEVPLFWHRLSGQVTVDILGWAFAQWGAAIAYGEVLELLLDLPLQKLLQQFSGRDPTGLNNDFEIRRNGWQGRVLEWSNLGNRNLETRSGSTEQAATLLWNELNDGSILKTFLKTRCSLVPHALENLHRSYLLAPAELALCVAYQLEIPEALRDDLIYARYAISPDAFDNAYCIAVTLMERMK